MDKVRSSAPTASTATGRRGIPVMSRIKRKCISFSASLQEGFRYFKALLVGQAKRLAARNEKEASEADLQATKMQIQAADAAEHTKKRLKM
ncbi:PREDICTED: uncharacterized protein LOC104595542 [Nelumbo nucifera]|uniref:Uncharacterized protein n=2 Tax=Nelumbo nucifera TaxID=4432 RepID=A0A822ZGV2_NELNU|nr:PREDICTED: uncharacterized protein LOC104595542 [Nelumbo nucifera]DAD40888.1 TPA_asm: hypothetical protein HUJ06_015211 [Nelumbo nucifera]